MRVAGFAVFIRFLSGVADVSVASLWAQIWTAWIWFIRLNCAMAFCHHFNGNILTCGRYLPTKFENYCLVMVNQLGLIFFFFCFSFVGCSDRAIVLHSESAVFGHRG